MKHLSNTFDSLSMICKPASSIHILISMSLLQDQYHSLTEGHFKTKCSEQLVVYPEATVTVCDQGVRPEVCSSRFVHTIAGSEYQTLLFFIAPLFRNQIEKYHTHLRVNSN